MTRQTKERPAKLPLNALGLTYHALVSMNEADLRDRVLKPLLVAIGFRDVTLWHGGVLEQGKDFVAWMPDALGQPIWTAVVAKAGKITGSVHGNGSAGDVGNQIRQAFNSAFPSPISGGTTRVTQCWVMASGKISKEALFALANVIGNPVMEAQTRFLDADAIWDLVTRHLPFRAITSQLSDAGKRLQTLDPNHDVRTIVDANSVTYSVIPKPGIPSHLVASAGLELTMPDTPEGRATQADLKRHLMGGAAVTIPGEFVSNLTLPDFIHELMDSDSTLAEIRLPERRTGKMLVVDVNFVADNGPTVALPHVVLINQRAGASEVVFETPADDPIALRVVVNTEAATLNLTFDLQKSSRNAHTQQRLIEFSAALAMGGIATLTLCETGLPLLRGGIAAGVMPTPNVDLARLISWAVEIQAMTRVPLTVPQRDITGEEAYALATLAGDLNSGERHGTLSPFVVNLSRADAIAVLAEGAGALHGVMMAIVREAPILFDTPVPVTRTARLLEAASLSEPDRRDVETFLAARPDALTVPVRLSANGGPMPVMVRCESAHNSYPDVGVADADADAVPEESQFVQPPSRDAQCWRT